MSYEKTDKNKTPTRHGFAEETALRMRPITNQIGEAPPQAGLLFAAHNHGMVRLNAEGISWLSR